MSACICRFAYAVLPVLYRRTISWCGERRKSTLHPWLQELIRGTVLGRWLNNIILGFCNADQKIISLDRFVVLERSAETHILHGHQQLRRGQPKNKQGLCPVVGDGGLYLQLRIFAFYGVSMHPSSHRRSILLWYSFPIFFLSSW